MRSFQLQYINIELNCMILSSDFDLVSALLHFYRVFGIVSHFVSVLFPICRRSVVFWSSSCRITLRDVIWKLCKTRKNERPNCTIFLCVFFIKYKKKPYTPTAWPMQSEHNQYNGNSNHNTKLFCHWTEMSLLLLENYYSPSFSLKNFIFRTRKLSKV